MKRFLLALLIVLIPCMSQAMDVTLKWDPNTESDLAGYKIYFGQTKGGPYTGAGSPIIIYKTATGFVATSPEWKVPNLASGTWYFVATAYDTEGLESGYSNEVSATPTCCAGVTGNVNMTGITDLSDLSALVSYLTGGGYLLPCYDVANINASRVVVGLHTRIPEGIWKVLLLLVLLGMFSVGYQMAIAGSRRSWTAIILAISFSIIIVLIEALDRPQTHLIPVSQFPIEYLQTFMDSELQAK